MRLCGKLALGTMPIRCFMFLNVGRPSGSCACMAPARVAEPAEQLMILYFPSNEDEIYVLFCPIEDKLNIFLFAFLLKITPLKEGLCFLDLLYGLWFFGRLDLHVIT